MSLLRKKFLKLLIFIGFLHLFPSVQAQDLRLAVASNFATTAKELVRLFSGQTGFKVSVSTASTGKFYAQVVQGAPFDVLLAADRSTPERLSKEGFAFESTLYDYALGRLMFVTTYTGQGESAEQVLSQLRFKKLAIANPELAPYGRAAKQTLTYLDLERRVTKQIVMAENIGQAAQFVLTGNADAGFLPQALVIEASDSQKMTLNSWLIPQPWHDPILQTAVLLKRGEGNPAAKAFMIFLKSSEARSLIKSHGYD